ncbi:MAG: GntR family transcriptional regulator [Anaerolineales bacterium]|nr:GntR family transcriptional regulator [Anaerolineales bacterium]
MFTTAAQPETLAPNQLRHLIANRLRAAILANEIKPGEWLRQEQLAQKFGVSHTPVREALQDLVGEGVVEHIPYRGIRVIEFSIADLFDLYATRAFLESLATRHAAQHITAEQLAELNRLNNAMELERVQKHWLEYRQVNRRFHQVIYRASQHAYLIRTLDQMWTAFPTMMLGNFPATAARPIPRRGASDRQEHLEIIAALQARNGERAERLMRAHIEESGRRIAAVLKAEK